MNVIKPVKISKASFVEPIFSSREVAERKRQEFIEDKFEDKFKVEPVETRVLFDGTRCFSFKAWVMPNTRR